MSGEALKERLVREVDERADELITLCSDLIKVPSENPPGDSTEISAFIQGYLEERGLAVERYEPHPRMISLLSSLGDDGGKELVFCGHSDVVPAGNLDKWSFSPVSGEVKDGWLLGRGASDMKAGLGGILFVVGLLSESGVRLPGKLSLAVVPDEETGSAHGLRWLFEEGYISGDGALIAEPSSRLNPTLGQKGGAGFVLHVKGVPGHGSLGPIAGKNAITDACRAIDVIQELWEHVVTVPADVKELVRTSQKYVAERDGGSEYAPFLERISVNIGVIEGGTKVNMVPDECTVEVDCRLPFGITQRQMAELVESKLAPLGIDYSVRRNEMRSEANYTPATDPVCQAVIGNLRQLTGEDAYGVMQWATSDARFFREHGIPVLQYGPAYLPTIHGYDERVQVEDIVLAAKVYAGTVVDFLYG